MRMYITVRENIVPGDANVDREYMSAINCTGMRVGSSRERPATLETGNHAKPCQTVSKGIINAHEA